MTEHTITIKTSPKFKPHRTLVAVGAQVGVIGVGVIADSPAMQWAGFGVLALMLITLTARDKSSGLTFDEARKKIDKIEIDSD